MNEKKLFDAPVALSQYNVQQAFYQKDDGIEYHETDKGVKLFATVDELPGRRVNFWMPKSLMVKADGHDAYTHVKYSGLSFLKENIAKSIKSINARGNNAKQ